MNKVNDFRNTVKADKKLLLRIPYLVLSSVQYQTTCVINSFLILRLNEWAK